MLQKQYDNHVKRPIGPFDEAVVNNMYDYKRYQEYLGNEKHYHDFLVFFEREINKKGYEAVINEYCLKGDERANDMLVRMFMGFLHPIIHLGFGVEFKQPAIIAEALAQAAVHGSWLSSFLLSAEKAAQTTGRGKNMVDLLDEIRADTKLSSAARWEDDNKIRDGIMVRAPEEMIKYASQWKVAPRELMKTNAEMTNAVGKSLSSASLVRIPFAKIDAVYFTGGAQHPPKLIK